MLIDTNMPAADGASNNQVVKPDPYGKIHISRLSTDVQMVTPQMAKLLRQTCHFERQRPISDNNVARLSSEMAHGWFTPGTPIFVGVMPNRSMVILNGNHTLEAVAAGSFPVPLTFIYYQVADIEEAGTIYATFDTHAKRSWLAVLQGVGRTENMPFAKHAMAALPIIMTDFFASDPGSKLVHSRNARIEEFDLYSTAASSAWEAVSDKVTTNRRMLIRAPVFAVAMVTFRSQPSMAEEFWSGAAADDGLATDDPRKALLRYLQADDSGTNKFSTVQAVSMAWNHFFKRSKVKIISPGKTNVFSIAGTHWSKPRLTFAGRSKKTAELAAAKPSFEMGTQINGFGVATPITMFGG
jgi:hypothetical protein